MPLHRVKPSWRRRLNQNAPVMSTLTGLLIVYGGFILLQNDIYKLVAVTIGLVFLEIGLWYGANPVLTSERRYKALRNEIDRFINLARELNAAVVQGLSQEEVDRVKNAMHSSVDLMGQLAGKSQVKVSDLRSPNPASSEVSQ
ncbi:MAG: hypothetical protein AB4050_15690 [Synechococcus sp.]